MVMKKIFIEMSMNFNSCVFFSFFLLFIGCGSVYYIMIMIIIMVTNLLKLLLSMFVL